jgi:hypothetical protein
LRKNSVNSRVFLSLELTELCSGWISAVQRITTADFDVCDTFGLSGGRRLATPLGNMLFMTPQLPV